ncbi:MAG: thioredoxin family protein [Bacteroidia bacterium]
MAVISEASLSDWLRKHPLAILFFKTKDCGVCHTQLPHIQSLAEEIGIDVKVIDLSENMHLAASQMVLSAPVTKVFYQGKEVFKEGAYLNFEKLRSRLQQLKENQAG